jgi:hypothetical protein
MRTLEDRLTALETLVTAAPPALSVDTLRERVKLGDAAKVELSRTLLPWKAEHSEGRPPRFFRRSADGRNDYRVYVPEGIIGETRYHIGADPYAKPQIQLRIECDPADTARVMQLADLVFAIAGFRLEGE